MDNKNNDLRTTIFFALASLSAYTVLFFSMQSTVSFVSEAIIVVFSSMAMMKLCIKLREVIWEDETWENDAIEIRQQVAMAYLVGVIVTVFLLISRFVALVR